MENYLNSPRNTPAGAEEDIKKPPEQKNYNKIVLKKASLMKKILIITREKSRFSDLSAGFENKGYVVSWGDSAESKWLVPGADQPSVGIIDETVDGQTCFELARKVIKKNVFINLVLVSELPEKKFHDAAEGLGILAHIPLTPESSHAEKIIASLGTLL